MSSDLGGRFGHRLAGVTDRFAAVSRNMAAQLVRR
jgi:hypothetical protein